MSRIEKTVFISYRRTNASWALAIYQDLTQHGYDAFIDFQGIASGAFERVILENIRARQGAFSRLAHALGARTLRRSEGLAEARDRDGNAIPAQRRPCHAGWLRLRGTFEREPADGPAIGA